MTARVTVVHRIRSLRIAAPLMVVVMVMMVQLVQEDLTLLLFISHVSIACTYAHMFLNLSTNYDIWLIVGETEFTHATQDHDHGAPQLERRMYGPTGYNTP
jgi:hypothetical protein